MLFNSFTFLIFLPVVFILYWSFPRNLKIQNWIILIASYIFYGSWDPRFLILLFISSSIDFICGLKMQSAPTARTKKFFMLTSLLSNLSILAFFKYFNFFADSFRGMCLALGWQVSLPLMHIILPVGISFYTFQSLSYTFDVYRGKMKATADPVAFFAFLSFFPQLVAGPIERARNLLPQFLVARTFDEAKARDGLRQMLWGFFKKIVIADRLALHVDAIFASPLDMSATDLTLGIIFFSFQIYCDFSGYTDIAIGTARLFGHDLMRNFNYPYFSRTIIEFWQRWHISLSTWFRDYVYIPIGGNKGGVFQHRRNLVVTFLLSGLWHGANWTFIYWGALHALYYILTMVFVREGEFKRRSPIVEFVQILFTFALVGIGWVFFRSENIQQAFLYFVSLFRFDFQPVRPVQTWDLLILGLFICVEILQRKKVHGLDIGHMPVWGRWAVYFAVIFWIMALYVPGKQFIYFQF